MATLYEYFYTTDSGDRLGHSQYKGQTFIPQINHNINKVVLKLYRAAGNSPGTASVSIYKTGGDHFPTGISLASGTTNGNTVGPGIEWREILFSSNPTLEVGQEYVILALKSASGTWTELRWRYGSSDPPLYERGTAIYGDFSSGWHDTYYNDYGFEEWGVIPIFSLDWPEPRPENYDPDKIFDYNLDSWVDINTLPAGGGRYKNQVIVMSDQGKIYFGGI